MRTVERYVPTTLRRAFRLGVVLAGLAFGAAAQAQILRPAGGIAGLPDALPAVGRATGDIVDRTVDASAGLVRQALDPSALAQTRIRRLDRLIAANRRVLEADPAGNPIARGEVLGLALSPGALAAAEAAGFRVVGQERLAELQLEATVLRAPEGVSAREAMQRLRRLDPAGTYDFNHLYLSSGEAAGAAAASGAAPLADAAGGARVGLIDTGVSTGLAVFGGVAIHEASFAGAAPIPAAHGTATASLISGRLGGFHGAAPGAELFVADVYGSLPAGGSAADLARALEWMAEVRAPVINVSLVGPPNALVEAAVRAISNRGARIVAAVGNDGPAAPPAYPASYPEVIAVTPVDARGHVLPEAGRALHVDFAAPGAGLMAADLGGGLAPVRGSSFAAPIVTGRLARLLRRDDQAEAAKALAELAREARPAGREAGHGVIGEDVRLADSHR